MYAEQKRPMRRSAQAFNTGNNNKPFSLAPQSIKKLNRQSRTSLENYLISSSLAWRAGRAELSEAAQRATATHRHTHSPASACIAAHIIPSTNSLPTANSMGGFKNSFPSSQTHMRREKSSRVCFFSLARINSTQMRCTLGKRGCY
jgi:hypothetical protein